MSATSKQEKDQSFADRVRRVVSDIPIGGTLSYREVAERAGSPRACRAVGNILKKNYDPDVPCHRVVRSDGSTGKYNRGIERKRELLREEQLSSRSTSVQTF